MSAPAVPWTIPAPTLTGSTTDLIAGHQFRFKAGVPGCSCGEEFTDSSRLPASLHAVHLAPLVVHRVLAASAAALRSQLPGADAEAAVSVLAGMVRHESNPADGRHDDGNP